MLSFSVASCKTSDSHNGKVSLGRLFLLVCCVCLVPLGRAEGG